MLGYNLCITKTYTELDAIKYKQSKGKIYCLNPAIERHLPKGAGQNLLDVGCGDGFYSTLANSKDYNYHGIDLSQGMIQKAKQLNPNVNFYTGSCFELDKHFSKGQFDVVISNMLFPEFSSVNEIKKTMEQISNVLKPSGLFILTTSHPAFNRYMRKYFLNDPAVETDFYSYFDSGKSYTVKSRSTGIVHEDHHFTLESYVNSLIQTGFYLSGIDECKPTDEAKNDDPEYLERIMYPVYILFKAVKLV